VRASRRAWLQIASLFERQADVRHELDHTRALRKPACSSFSSRSSCAKSTGTYATPLLTMLARCSLARL
jgi:hypothetical protein